MIGTRLVVSIFMSTSPRASSKYLSSFSSSTIGKLLLLFSFIFSTLAGLPQKKKFDELQDNVRRNATYFIGFFLLRRLLFYFRRGALWQLFEMKTYFFIHN